MKWLETDGGPFILVPRTILSAWAGFDGGDYERSCSVDGYLGLLDVGGQSALVLSDEPMATTFFRPMNQDRNNLYLVRWMCGPGESTVESVIPQVIQASFSAPKLEMVIFSEDLVLFDSGYPGSDLPTEFLDLKFEPGQYEIDTADFSPKDEVRLIVHRFTQLQA